MVQDSCGVRTVESTTHLWQEGEGWQLSPEPVVDIGGGDAEENQLFRVAGALQLSDGRIVIANGGTNKLRFFDANGPHLSTVGGTGEGPGEFRRLSGLARYGADSLLAIERSQASILDLNGQFARGVIPTPPEGYFQRDLIHIFSDGSILGKVSAAMSDFPVGLTRLDFHLIRYDDSGTSGQIFGAFAGADNYNTPVEGGSSLNIAPPFGRNTWVRTLGEHIYVADNERYELLRYSSGGRLEMIVRKKQVHLQVTEDDLAEMKRPYTEVSDANRRRRYDRAFRELPVSMTMPAYGARYWGANAMTPIVVDALNDFWVREYTRPSDPSSHWSVFDSDGYWLGTIQLPDGFAPFDIGPDYVLGVWRDEDEVEHVQLYDLIKPPQ